MYGRHSDAVSKDRARSASAVTRAGRLALLWAAIACAACSGPPPAHAQQSSRDSGVLRIRQLDVGQGDAALITTPEGRHVLIDAGPNPDLVASLLRREGVDTLDLVVASHNHADHIGGMPRVFETLVVRAYVENGIPHTTAAYRRTISAVEREPGLIYLQATDRTITVGTLLVRILGSPAVNRSQNDNSVGVVLEHGAFRALYTGDSELAQLAGWLRQRRVGRVTVVKVAHHGSHNGTSIDWVRATAPHVALISAGGRNSYGHPSPQAEFLWKAVGARIYRTDRHGTIEVRASIDGRFTVHVGSSEGAPHP